MFDQYLPVALLNSIKCLSEAVDCAIAVHAVVRQLPLLALGSVFWPVTFKAHTFCSDYLSVSASLHLHCSAGLCSQVLPTTILCTYSATCRTCRGVDTASVRVAGK